MDNQDNKITISELKSKAKDFIDERDWDQYHTLKNLGNNIVIEAAELMEIFLWAKDSEIQQTLKNKKNEIENEVADIFFSLLCFCNKANIDLTFAFKNKLLLIAKKYPIEKVKGKSNKYTDYK